MTAFTLFMVAVTWYAGPYIGGDRYCGGTYSLDAEPWVAVDINEIKSGRVHCGDMLLITGGNVSIKVQVMDTGTFRGYYIKDYGPGVPIVVDLPKHLFSWPGMSRLVNVTYLSEIYQRMEMER